MSNWHTSESAIGIGRKNGRDNQQEKELVAEAVYEGTLESFLRGWFP